MVASRRRLQRLSPGRSSQKPALCSRVRRAAPPPTLEVMHGAASRCPQRDSNPRYSLERAVTWAASRWGPGAGQHSPQRPGRMLCRKRKTLSGSYFDLTPAQARIVRAVVGSLPSRRDPRRCSSGTRSRRRTASSGRESRAASARAGASPAALRARRVGTGSRRARAGGRRPSRPAATRLIAPPYESSRIAAPPSAVPAAARPSSRRIAMPAAGRGLATESDFAGKRSRPRAPDGLGVTLVERERLAAGPALHQVRDKTRSPVETLAPGTVAQRLAGADEHRFRAEELAERPCTVGL